MHNFATKEVGGVRAQPVRLLIAMGLVILCGFQEPAGQGFDFKIVAQILQNGITQLKPGLGINDNGKVAFFKVTDAGEAVVVGDGFGSSQCICCDLASADKTIGSVSINNHDDVARQYQINRASSPGVVIRYSDRSKVTISRVRQRARLVLIDARLGGLRPVFSCPEVIAQRIVADDNLEDPYTKVADSFTLPLTV